MCGIVGAIAKREVSDLLLEGLKRLEYRGYDSAGVAILNNQQCQRLRTLGKVGELAKLVDNSSEVRGNMGIAHTRWATHGKPSEANAHPHMSGEDIALVHNGIIENFQSLQDDLKASGYRFQSETDTEIIVHLIHRELASTPDLLRAVQKACTKLSGAFALAVLWQQDSERLIVVRKGSPLVIGLGEGENFIASDQFALLPITKQFIYLEEGDIAEIKLDSYQVYDKQLQTVTRDIHHSANQVSSYDKGEYRHYMLKEIYEQPNVVSDTIEGRLSAEHILAESLGVDAIAALESCEHVQIVACGTSYHAGLVARYWIEELAGIPCQVEIASEFRYRKTVVSNKTLFITISQSGETADTLAALQGRNKNADYLASLSVCNVAESALVRESDLVFMTRAGTEIGVASTKAFTTQLTSLLMIAILLGRYNGLSAEAEHQLVASIRELPQDLQKVLALDNTIADLATQFADKEHALFLGRGTQYPIAMEGALKLKEISYIHAEAYPAGELKHGPLALVDNNMPVISVAPNDELFEKLKSNLYEVKARGGQLYVFADESLGLTAEEGIHIINLPATHRLIAPILYTIPLQLLAYHAALVKGTDVDQPRNLAKSVTVE